jgi:hypothetical protein
MARCAFLIPEGKSLNGSPQSTMSPLPLFQREVSMQGTRRSFLRDFAGVSGTLLMLQASPPIPAPRRKIPVDPPEPAEKQDAEKPETSSLSMQRHAQEKEFRETMEQLFIRVRDLRVELEHTPTAEVFSVSIFKQTQEIEKLAKRLKNYARA